MSKIFVRQSCIFAKTILVLLTLTVGTFFAEEVRPTTKSSKPDINPWEDFRLPKYTIPVHYDLLLYPNVQNNTFSGSVNITVNVTRNIDVFVVHAYSIMIRDAKVFEYMSGSEMSVVSTFFYEPHENFVVKTEKEVEPGIYKLSYKFFGSLVGSKLGFHISRYRDRNNQTRYLVTSKFQPTYARRAFPCYDEPSFKSTFTISLVHEPGHIALSNMPVDETISYTEKDLLVTKFQKSVPMVTYLVCFIVGDFDYAHTQTTTSTGKELRVHAVPDQINNAKYALKFGARVLEYFKKYSGIDYPLPKLDDCFFVLGTYGLDSHLDFFPQNLGAISDDHGKRFHQDISMFEKLIRGQWNSNMVAIPDYVSGSMGHLGIITLRDTDLLYNKKSSSLQNKQRIATVISLKMAHMWFGNLVTMEWWDDLWLSEGFATYFGYKGVSDQYPEWDIMSQFIMENVQPAMNLDSAMSSLPHVQLVNLPEDILDDISYYKKGASILRMLESFVGKEKFCWRKGISNFLQEYDFYKFKSARIADLWAILSKTCRYQGNRSIIRIMKTWTDQIGFPFVTVRRVRSDQTSSVFAAKQRRFVKNEEHHNQSMNSTKEYLWSIPLSYVTSNGKTDIIWIHDEKEKEFTVSASETEWVKFNVNQTGYYLVNYEQEEWERFTDLLMTNHEELSPSDRVNLLFDSFYLATAGNLDYRIPLNMTLYLKKETYYAAWEIALQNLKRIKEYFSTNTVVEDIIKEHIRSLIKDLYRKYKWMTSPKEHSERMLKRTIIKAACDSDNFECLVEAKNLLTNQWINKVELDPDIRDLVLSYGLNELGDEMSWDSVWEHQYLDESDPIKKYDLQNSLLGNWKDFSQIERFIEAAQNQSLIMKHDYFFMFFTIARNKGDFSQVSNLISINWSDLVKAYGIKETERFAYLVYKYYDSEEDLKEVREFYKKNKVSQDGQHYRRLATESILENIRWKEMHTIAVTEWFEKNVFMPWKNFRLPRHIMPSKYNITLFPDISNAVHNGSEEILVTITEPTNYILLHEKELKIFNTEVIRLETDEDIPMDEVFRYERNDFYVMIFDKTIPEGEYVVKLAFSGKLKTDPYTPGMVRYSYFDEEDNSTRYFIATKFGRFHAREVFPSFDEPDMKATFKLILIHEDNYTAISNMPQENHIRLTNNIIQSAFQESVKMSTYLVCYVISDFDYLEREYKGKKIRVYAQKHKIEEAEHGLNMTVKFLKSYEEYFDIPYALPKLDSVAIPNYVVGGMEHWGLILYEANNFLFNGKESPEARLSKVDRLISHEIAHQWFGNLVTMKWWNDLWLNEGFSSYFMYIPLRDDYPLREVADQYEVIKLARTMLSLHQPSIVMNVSSKTDADRMFSRITYDKGAAVVKMLDYILKDDFKKGIINYLKKYAFKNADTNDLKEELSNASSKDLNIPEIIDTWTLQEGYPYIELQRNGKTLIASQQRVLPSISDTESTGLVQDIESYIWKIPLVYKNLATGKEYTLWLNKRNDTFQINAMEDDILLFNPNFLGYYIVKYDKEDYQKIVKRLMEDHTDFSVIDRYIILHNAFNLVEIDRLNFDVILDLTKYLKKEKEWMPWTIMRKVFELLTRKMDGNSETVKLLKEYIRLQTQDLYDELVKDKNDSSHFQSCYYYYLSCTQFPFIGEKDLITIIVHAACESQNEKCLETLNSELWLWIQGEKYTADRKMFLKYAIPYAGNSTLWDLMYEKFSNPNTTESEKRDTLFGLASFSKKAEIMKTINMMMQDPLVDSYSAREIFEELAKNRFAAPVLWQYVYANQNWKDILLRFNMQNHTEGIQMFCGTFKSFLDFERFKMFLKTLPQVNDDFIEECTSKYPPYTLTIQDALKWSEKYERTIQNWLRRNSS